MKPLKCYISWQIKVKCMKCLHINFIFLQDIEYIRSHYNIEDFIYYNHHRRQDHGHLHHYALNPIFSHLSKHFLKVSSQIFLSWINICLCSFYRLLVYNLLTFALILKQVYELKFVKSFDTFLKDHVLSTENTHKKKQRVQTDFIHAISCFNSRFENLTWKWSWCF